MREITLNVERDDDTGWYIASWDDAGDRGGITTQGQDLQALQDNVREAVRCHFGPQEVPKRILLHFLDDLVLTAA